MSLPKIRVGQTDLQTIRLAYGCWRIVGKNPDAVTADTRKAGFRAIAAAYEAGYTLFDHADIYCGGICEEVFGQALKEITGMREQVVITTKCGVRRPDTPVPGDPFRYDLSADHIIESCDCSLRRLRSETIDLYLLHRPDCLMDPTEVAEAFTQLKEAGKVREFGVSNFTPSQVSLLQSVGAVSLVANQIQLSLGELSPLGDGTLDQCLAQGMMPMAWSPLGGGWLVVEQPSDLSSPNHAQRLQLRVVIEQIAGDHNTSQAVIALAWLLKHPANIVPIIGSTNPEHIREAVKAVTTSLSREEWYRLLEAARGHRLP